MRSNKETEEFIKEFNEYVISEKFSNNVKKIFEKEEDNKVSNISAKYKMEITGKELINDEKFLQLIEEGHEYIVLDFTNEIEGTNIKVTLELKGINGKDIYKYTNEKNIRIFKTAHLRAEIKEREELTDAILIYICFTNLISDDFKIREIKKELNTLSIGSLRQSFNTQRTIANTRIKRLSRG